MFRHSMMTWGEQFSSAEIGNESMQLMIIIQKNRVRPDIMPDIQP